MVLRYGDLFSGISCPAFALKQLGIPFEYKFACEIDQSCRDFLVMNHQPEQIFEDVRKIESLPPVDLLIMGFPCQPFSSANTKISVDDHPSRDLFLECGRAIEMSQPEIFIMENVAGLLFKSSKSYFDRIKQMLDGLTGYHYRIETLDSKDYGAAMRRKRVFIIGRKLGQSIHFPSEISCDALFTTEISEVNKKLIDIINFDLDLLSLCKTKNDKIDQFEKNVWYYGNGQYCGRFFKGYKLEKDSVAYCIHTRCAKDIFYKKDDGNVYGRRYSNDELKNMFRLEIPVDLTGQSVHFMHKALGNGMDVGLMKMLIASNF